MNYASETQSELYNRPVGPALDHVAFAREGFEGELERTSRDIKLIDIRMANTDDEIARLRRQQADDRHELDALVLANRAARRALAELDGVAP